MKIIIADDHPIFRQGLLRGLEGQPEIECLAEVADGREALRLIKELQPDIAVLDISMPGLEGLEVARCARQAGLPTDFVILTMYKEEQYFEEAMDIGVKGYLLKDNAVLDLVSCLKAVAAGRSYVSPFISDYLVRREARRKGLETSHPKIDSLTPMERKIIRQIAASKTSREIAQNLGISVRTVQNHRHNVCGKLELHGSNKLLQFALENKSLL